MSSDIATTIQERGVPRRQARRGSPRTLAIHLIGPLTILAGVVWAVAQPYRIVFLDSGKKGFYDYLFQPPLLVVAVGLIYALVLAPGLVQDLETEPDGPTG
jgi:hypothetical protein